MAEASWSGRTRPRPARLPATKWPRTAGSGHALPAHGTWRVLRALLAGGLLVAVTAGVPVMLLAALGDPRTGWADLGAGDLSDRALLAVLSSVAWLSWAQFCLQVVLELRAAVRRTPAVDVRGLLPGQQVLVRSLVAGLLAVLPVGGPAVALATATSPGLHATTVVAASVLSPGQAAQPLAAAGAPSDSTQRTSMSTQVSRQAPTATPAGTDGAITHVITRDGPGTLWDMAREYLGQGERWREIWALNAGRVQADGHRMISPGLLRVGWSVLVPVTDPPGPSPGSSAQRSGILYVVEPGDHLGTVAARFLGQFSDYRQIQALNSDLISATSGPHGPDTIQVGWVLHLPAGVRDRGSREHARGRLQIPTHAAPPPKRPRPGTRTAPVSPMPSATGSVGSGGSTPAPSPSTPRHRASPTTPDTPTPVTSSPAAPTSAPAPTGGSVTGSPELPPTPRAQRPRAGSPGVSIPGGWLSLPLAGAILAAAGLAWQRRRRHHRYSSDLQDFDVEQSELEVMPPVVSRVRQAIREHALALEQSLTPETLPADHPGPAFGPAPSIRPGQKIGAPFPAASSPASTSTAGAVSGSSAGSAPEPTDRTRPAGAAPDLPPPVPQITWRRAPDRPAGAVRRPVVNLQARLIAAAGSRVAAGTQPAAADSHPGSGDPSSEQSVPEHSQAAGSLAVAGPLGFITSTGLGLRGPGAPAAGRALLIAALSAGNDTFPAGREDRPQVLLTQEALEALLGLTSLTARQRAPGLSVCSDLLESLAALDELVHDRERRIHDGAPAVLGAEPAPALAGPILVIAAVPAAWHQADLAARLMAGAGYGARAVLLGDWTWGTTVFVDESGHVIPQRTSGRHSARPSTRATAEPAIALGTGSTGPESAGPGSTSEQQRLDILSSEATLGILEAFAPPSPSPDSPAPAEQEARIPVRSTHRPPADVGEAAGRHDRPGPGPAMTAATASPSAAPMPEQTPATTTGSQPATASPLPQPAPDTAGRGPGQGHRVRVQVLGRPGVLDDTSTLWPGLRRHAALLLVYLALHRDGARLRDIKIALWPGVAPEKTNQRLSTEVAQLRRTIRLAAGDDTLQPVMNAGGHYRLDSDLVGVDLWDLQDEFTAVAGILDPARRTAALQSLVARDGAHLADGFEYDWIDTARENLRRRAVRSRLALAESVAQDDPRSAAVLLDEAADLDDTNEELARQAIQALAVIGDHAGVEHRAAALRHALRRIGEKPAAETVALVRTVFPRADERVPADRTAARRRPPE